MGEITTKHGRIAVDFAQALVEGHFENAHRLLAPSLQSELTPAVLHRKLDAMHTYAPGPPRDIWFDEREDTMTNWPDKRPDDLGWAYVSIEGDGFLEAVTVIVAEDGIRNIIWGRP